MTNNKGNDTPAVSNTVETLDFNYFEAASNMVACRMEESPFDRNELSEVEKAELFSK